MLIIQAHLATFDDDHRLLPGGRILVGDDGRIVAVLEAGETLPAAFAAARSIAYDGFAYPGLIDSHNHIPYNTIGLWTIPTRPEPFVDHNEWTRPVLYNRQITAPQRLLGWAAGPSLLAYVETKALLGGTTTIQGSGNPAAAAGVLARNLDSEHFSVGEDRYRVDTIVKRDVAGFDSVRAAMARGNGYIYHLAEGVDRPAMAAEWQLALDGGVIRERLMAIHGTGLSKAELGKLAEVGATLVWSPFSNLWLYGGTADILTARAKGLRLCLGSDWAPSGTRNVLGELKVASLWNQDPAAWYPPGAAVPPLPAAPFADQDLCDMVTRNPGDAVALVYGPQIGRIQAGYLADLILVRARQADPYRNLIEAVEADVELALVGGEARCGTQDLVVASGVKGTSVVAVAGSGGAHKRRVLIRNPKDPSKTMTWTAVLKRLKAVRRSPEVAEQEIALALALAGAGGDSLFVVEGDMPFGDPGDGAFAGPAERPKTVPIPAIDPPWHDGAYFDAVDAHSYHRGLLSPLRRFYGF